MRILARLAVVGLACVCACRPDPSRATDSKDVEIGPAPTTGTDTVPDDGQWVRPAKDFASTRFSGLTEINATNVAQLRLVSSFSTGVLHGHEAAPIVAGSTMYVITPFPNIVYALDLTKPGFPVKWQFNPKPEPFAQGVACCDVVNRGVVYDNGKIFFNTLDDHTIALDAESGKVVWNTKVGDINIGETMTMAPLVVKGKVLVGDSGGEMGVRGWLKALDASSGRVLWTAYHTGPDSDVLIGPAFKPHYAQDQGKDLGVSSWPPDMWKIGGGTMWGWISYDAEQDLIFYGSGNPGPWNPDVRPGDNKWTTTMFARKPDTGEAVWAYQISPHDLHDYDGINEQILVDMPVNGVKRKVLIRPERNGYVYVMDRTTGEVLSAKAFGYVNSTSGVDVTTGMLQYNPEKETQVGKVVRDICPAAPGMKDWQPTAYSPKTGMLYIPHQNLCMDEEGVSANYIAGTPYVGMNVKMTPGHGGNRGEFEAWNPQTGKQVWAIKEDLPVWSGTVVTAGDVAFYGTMAGLFKAVDARSGKVLWQFDTGSGIIGQPITFKAPDGHQYVAILSGVGGWSGMIVSAGLDARDSSAALGFVNAMRDLPAKTKMGGKLFVFGL
jgi:PQQ-dependent dehydrogenase (methanol/ethanol family)